MLNDVKLALRIMSTAFDSEILDIIASAEADLQLCGIVLKANDPLIKRAVVLYCKANFGTDENSEKYQKSYEMIKCSLKIAGGYNGR